MSSMMSDVPHVSVPPLCGPLFEGTAVGGAPGRN
jgi:hypothetical protein